MEQTQSLYSSFTMKEVCPFFLIELQKPLSSIILISVIKKDRKYHLICTHRTKPQIESFVQRIKKYGEVICASEINEYTIYNYKPRGEYEQPID